MADRFPRAVSSGVTDDNARSESRPRTPLWLLVWSLLLVLVIVALTILAVNYGFAQEREKEFARLQTIADLKAGQIEIWLRERQADARYLGSNRFSHERPVGSDAPGAADLSERLLSALDDTRRVYDYAGVYFVGDNSSAMHSRQGSVSLDPVLKDAVHQVIANGVEAIVGPHIGADGRSHLDFIAPLWIGGEQSEAAVVLRVDPERFLFPILDIWPAPSDSGESLLVRLDGDEIVYVNDLRHFKGESAQLRIPLTRRELLAAQAYRGDVRQGSVMTGFDYRHVPAYGVVRRIQGTDWTLLSKMDRAEADRDGRLAAIWIAIIGLLVLVSSLTALYVFYQRQRLASERLSRALQSEKLHSLELLDAVVTSTTDAIFAKDETGCYLLCNTGAARVMGFAADQVIGRSDADLFPAAQNDELRKHDREVMEGGVTRQFEETFIVDGQARSFQVIKGPLRDREGALIGVFGISRDVTESRRIERELIASREELERRVDERTAELQSMTESLRATSEEQQAIFDAATVGIMLARDRIIRRCNRTMERLFGYAPDGMVGQSTRLLYRNAADYEDLWARMRPSVAAQGSFHHEMELMRQDGTTFWCRIMVQALDRDDLGKGFAGTFEDISVERQALADMERARDIAEDAARVKAEFLANMSHEIRTPMNSVIGMTHLALKADPSPKVRDYLQKIRTSSSNLLGIINDILDFSKLEANKVTVEHVDFTLDKVLADIAGVFGERAAGKGLELVIDAAQEVPLNLVGDPLRIEQVLINLASNAVKFTEHGAITIHVGLQEQRDGQVLLRFSVQDTGIGISGEQSQHLFQSFQQADASTTRKYGGTGLGLAISKRLVELMGGQIGVDSEPGAGSTFWFTTLVGVGKQDAARRRVPPDLSQLCALVVDDNDQARQVIVEMLGAMGISAMPASAGPEGLEAIRSADQAGRGFDLVYVDWKMPGMDGVEFGRAVSGSPLRKRPVLVMVTAYDQDEVRAAAEQAGFREIQVKPVTASTLFNSVMRLFAGTGAVSADNLIAEASSGPLTDQAALLGRRALLVEDNDLNQEVATAFLEAFGMRVDLAENGAIALDKVQSSDYDVVLMDMQMPVMDGLTATRALRAIDRLRDLPVIAMTANAMASDRERCLAAGMNDHVAKPIDPDDLLHKLLKWTRRGAASGLKPATDPDAGHEGAFGDQIADKLAGVPGLDAATGLRQAMGRTALYRDLLTKFAAGQHDVTDRLESALGSGDRKQAERLAHTLKGVSAQIGALEVRTLAERLEDAIRHDLPVADCRSLIASITEPLAALIGRLHDALGETAAPGATEVPFDAQQWASVRDRLLTLLGEDDAEAVEYFDNNEGLIHAALGDRFQWVAHPVRDFDFSTALERLQSAAR